MNFSSKLTAFAFLCLTARPANDPTQTIAVIGTVNQEGLSALSWSATPSAGKLEGIFWGGGVGAYDEFTRQELPLLSTSPTTLERLETTLLPLLLKEPENGEFSRSIRPRL